MKGRTVLILDDDPSITALQKTLLETHGCEAITTNDFGQFCQQIEPKSGPLPDLILLDLMMPEVDGVQVMRYLATRGIDLPIMISSGVDSDLLTAVYALADIYDLDLRGVVSKPFTPDGFVRRIADVLTGNAGDDTLSLAEVKQLIDADRIRVHYQPKLDVDLTGVQGLEALVRCDHPERGLLAPDWFMPAIERGPLLGRITQIVIQTVARDLQQWQQNGFRPKVAVNISARSLDDLQLPDTIGAILRENGVSSSDLVVEVTETTLEKNYANALEVLTRLRLLGIQLSLDDFGTGYTSESRLRGLPFTELKIDRSITSKITSSAKARQKLKGYLTLCQSLKLRSVAEGVETLEQQAMLKSYGCQQVQGYLMTPALSNADLLQWLDKGQWAQQLPLDSISLS